MQALHAYQICLVLQIYPSPESIDSCAELLQAFYREKWEILRLQSMSKEQRTIM